MNIFVCVKQVPDTEASLGVSEGKRIREEGIKWIVNPYDEYAIEEALKLREQMDDAKVIAVTVGPARAESALRTALAMGANEAVHVESEAVLDAAGVAAALGQAIKKHGEPGIVFMGKQAIDDDAGLVQYHLARNLEAGVAVNVVDFTYADGGVVVEREVEGGAREKISMTPPCLVGATKGLNEPRYPSIMGVMKAKKMPLAKMTLEELEMSADSPAVELESLSVPPEKAPGRMIEGEPAQAVKELVRLLRDEAKVL